MQIIKKRLILVGCGAFARELICWIEDAVDLGVGRKVTGFLNQNGFLQLMSIFLKKAMN
jgi:hypothetical protein